MTNPGRTPYASVRAGRHRHPQLTYVTAKLPKLRRAPGTTPVNPATEDRAGRTGSAAGAATTAALPWFTPESAPSENRPTTKGHS